MTARKIGWIALRVLVAFWVTLFFAGAILGLPAIYQTGGWPLMIACAAAPLLTIAVLRRPFRFATKGGQLRMAAELVLLMAIILSGMFGLAFWIALYRDPTAGFGAMCISMLLPAVVDLTTGRKYRARCAWERKWHDKFREGPIGVWQAYGKEPPEPTITFRSNGEGFYRTRAAIMGEQSAPTARFRWRLVHKYAIEVQVAEPPQEWRALNFTVPLCGEGHPCNPTILGLNAAAANDTDQSRADADDFDIDSYEKTLWPGPYLFRYTGEPGLNDAGHP